MRAHTGPTTDDHAFREFDANRSDTGHEVSFTAYVVELRPPLPILGIRAQRSSAMVQDSVSRAVYAVKRIRLARGRRCPPLGFPFEPRRLPMTD